MKISSVSSAFHITQAAATHKLNVLEEKGYVVRTVSADDKRVTLVRPTARGERLVAEEEERYYRVFAGLTAFLGEMDGIELQDGGLNKARKWGILDFVPILEQADAAEALLQTIRLAQAAEAWGYKRYWVSEHHDMPRLVSTNTEVMLAYIGAQTQRIRIGSGALLLPYYKPMKAVEAYHLLAAMYPDRVDLGIGRAPGGSAHVSLSLSDTYLEQVRRMPELLDDVVSLLSNRYRIEGEAVTARPTPPVRPQLWLLGTNAKSAQYAAERGVGYVFGQFMSAEDGKAVLASYRDHFQPSELLQEPCTIVAVGVVCAESSEDAAAISAAGLKAVFGGYTAAAAVDPATEARKLIRGTPVDVNRRLNELQKQYEADELMLVTMTGTYEQRLQSFRLLAGACYNSSQNIEK